MKNLLCTLCLLVLVHDVTVEENVKYWHFQWSPRSRVRHAKLNERLPNSENGLAKFGHSGKVLALVELAPLHVLSWS